LGRGRLGLLAAWLLVSVVTTVGAVVWFPLTMFFTLAFGASGHLSSSPGDAPAWGWALTVGLLIAAPLAVGAGVTGTIQLWAIGDLVPSPARWRWATVAGAVAAGPLAAGPVLAVILRRAVARVEPVLAAPEDLAALLLAIGAGTGLTQGLAQALALGPRVPRRWWWVVGCGAGASVAWLIVAGAATPVAWPEFFRVTVAAAVVGGLVSGLIAGLVLVRVLPERLPGATDQAETNDAEAARIDTEVGLIAGPLLFWVPRNRPPVRPSRREAEADIAARRAVPKRSWLQRLID
jgi:hypothetical protein